MYLRFFFNIVTQGETVVAIEANVKNYGFNS